MTIGLDRRGAEAADAADPLAHFRAAFHYPVSKAGDELVYLCGNSLGLMPRTAATIVQQELDDWRTLGVEGHFHARRPWMPYHEQLTEHTARLVGARAVEVVAMNTLTVNLHLMMASFYRPTPDRHAILIEAPAFPSDRYAAVSQIAWHGYDPATALIEVAPGVGEETLDMDRVADRIERDGDRIALVLLPGVQYYSGQALDMARLTRVARGRGCRVGFDLAHAVGNLPLALHDWGMDFAVWCTYKYLNAGPGAVGGCFVHERHADTDIPRFAGWWGHDKHTRFQMGPQFQAMRGAEGWQLSNPPILSLAPLVASMAIFDQAGMPALREKSLALTGYLEQLLGDRLADAIEIITPSDARARGCQLSLRVRTGNGRAVFDRLSDAGVVCDWREPDVIRVAPVPLYNRFADVYRFVELLERAVE